MKKIKGRGYIFYNDTWVELDSDKLIFDYEDTKDKTDGEYKPLEFLQSFMLINKIEHFLITYDEFENSKE